MTGWKFFNAVANSKVDVLQIFLNLLVYSFNSIKNFNI